MSENKTVPTSASVDEFLATVSDQRQEESRILIAKMRNITGKEPVMWGPSIIGFGSQHYTYDTGREGDMPRLAFSPRKASITIYFNEGFHEYGDELRALGPHKQSVSCLYLTKLEGVDLGVLEKMLVRSYEGGVNPRKKPTTAEEYIEAIPVASQQQFAELRALVKRVLPKSEEVLSYGIVGYKVDEKRARVYISGWKDHVALYPIPKDEDLRERLTPYIKGKGTLWFSLDAPLPVELLEATVRSLAD